MCVCFSKKKLIIIKSNFLLNNKPLLIVNFLFKKEKKKRKFPISKNKGKKEIKLLLLDNSDRTTREYKGWLGLFGKFLRTS